MVCAMADQTIPDHDWHRAQGIELFNGTWAYLDDTDRDASGDMEMLTAALASRHHWRVVGKPKNWAISDWQTARVFVALGEGSLAARFGQSSLDLVDQHRLEPFLRGSAHEVLARAAAVLGDDAARRTHLAAARDALEELTDDEDREVLAADIAEAESV